jgi:hypothetical protein
LFGAFFRAALGVRFGIVAARFFQGFAQRFPRLGQGTGAAIRAAFFQGHRHIPENLLHFAHSLLTPITPQPMPRGPQRQEHACVMFKGLGRARDTVQFPPGWFARIGVQRKRAAERDQLLRNGVGKAPFRQHQKRAFGFAFLFRAIAGHFTPDKHFGFEAAAWYWHFVDVVWLFLFAFVYVTFG